jgi:hypothetical protein
VEIWEAFESRGVCLITAPMRSDVNLAEPSLFLHRSANCDRRLNTPGAELLIADEGVGLWLWSTADGLLQDEILTWAKVEFDSWLPCPDLTQWSPSSVCGYLAEFG